MTVRFDKAYYERMKGGRSPAYLREIALAELRACFTPDTTVYGIAAYLTHLFDERPDILQQAESITMGQLFPAFAALDEPDAVEVAEVAEGPDLTSTEIVLPVEDVTRSRLQTKEVSKMRACILEVLEGDRRPRPADDIIEDATAIYERGGSDIRISRHKWMMHFATWRHREPHLFSKSYREGSNSEKDALWQLVDDRAKHSRA